MNDRKLLLTMTMMMAVVDLVPTQRPISSNGRIPGEINIMFKLQQVKANILKALNMTSPPNPRMLLAENAKAPSKTPRILDTSDLPLNVSLILSESTGTRRQDTISFRFDSRLRGQLVHLDSALLILFLHVFDSGDNSGRPGGSVPQPAPNHAAASHFWPQNTDTKAWTDDSLSPLSVNKLSSRLNPHSNTTSVAGNGIRRKGGTQQVHASRRQSSRDRRKQSQVKIILKTVDLSTNRKHKIGEKLIIIKGSTTTAIPVPKDVVVAAASSVNHTLVVQVSCKRCKGQVEVETVYKKFTKKNKKLGRRLNPNRPYLLIKMGSHMPSADLFSWARGREIESPNEVAKKRSRRTVLQTGISGERGCDVSTHWPARGSCCSEILNFTFEDLDLKFIIFPRGISTVVCWGSCSSPGNVSKWNRFGSRPNITTLPVNKHINHPLQRAQPSEQQVGRKQVLGYGSVQVSTTPGKRCVPAFSKPLYIVYLDKQNKAIITRLDNVVHQSCQCSSFI